jgi:hypothetical protein
LISIFSTVVGYKINIQKLVDFAYINIEEAGKEIGEIIPFSIAPPKLNTYED